MIGRWLVPFSVGLACIGFAPAAAAQLVFDASPTVRVQSGESETKRYVLSKKERMDFRVTIIRREGKFYWATRENLELLHSGSGAGHFFIAPKGAGYIKVFDTQYLPEGMRQAGPRFWYMEHLTMPGTLGTITYWGASDKFDLHDEE
jgi:hypothetical protein